MIAILIYQPQVKLNISKGCIVPAALNIICPFGNPDRSETLIARPGYIFIFNS